jgi:hypothetical protein
MNYDVGRFFRRSEKGSDLMTKMQGLMPVVALVAMGIVFAGSAIAQDAAPAASDDATAPEAVAEPSAPAFSQEQLDQMLAPIALYPDSLLIQLMMSSTYPLEIVAADRWRKKNASLEGEALDKALESEDWDPSVKAMTLFPDVLGRMSENLDWTQDLGDAFLAQQPQVLDTVQALRKQAYDAGNLKSGEQQNVVVNNETQVIEIEPAQPETVYVPQYNSAAVYGTPPPATPYYPEANSYSGTDMLMTGALSFGAGLLIGNLIWDDDSDCDWDDHYVYGGGYGGHNKVNINVDGDVNIGNQVGSGNRPGLGGGNRQPWQHNPTHRRGVNYRDTKTRQTFANKPGARPSLDRNAALGYNRDTLGSGGRIDKGGAAVGQPGASPGKIAGGMPSKVAASPKVGSGVAGKAPAKATSSPSRVASAPKKPVPSAVAQQRPASAIGSAGGNRPTAIGGLGGGSATRAASARGASSRGMASAGSKLGGGGAKSGGGRGR